MELHKVKREELPVLLNWLQGYLPESFQLYGAVREELRCDWVGRTHYTLGWPDILAVGDGPVEDPDCDYAPFYNINQTTTVFSPNASHLETLLTWPGFLDWTKMVYMQTVCPENFEVVKRISDAAKPKLQIVRKAILHQLEPDDITLPPIPEGLSLTPLDPDLHKDYVMSTWPFRRKFTDMYAKALIEHFPSLGLFDSQGNILAFEMGVEYGPIGFLHVRHDARGKGYAKLVMSHLAQIYASQNLPVMAAVIEENTAGLQLHESMGYKKVTKLRWLIHSMSGEMPV